MNLHLIFARARNGVVGHNNTLPWHLPEDLAHFKRTTLGCPVIMGRKTWDSLPAKFRPLPGRTNVVVTRQSDWLSNYLRETQSPPKPDTALLAATSLTQAIEQCGDAPDVWVIGGAQLWTLAMPLASSAVVTEIDLDVAGDTFAPAFDTSWHEVERVEHTSSNGVGYRFITLRAR